MWLHLARDAAIGLAWAAIPLTLAYVAYRRKRALAIPTMAALHASSQAVLASAMQFRALLESAPDAMVIVDRRGKIFLVNAQTERVFGYPRSELLGRPAGVLVPERLRDGFFTEHRGNRELVARRKDGSEFPIDLSTSPIETPNGVLISGAIRDISERKQTEQKVRGLLVAAQVVEAAPHAMLMIDRARTITSVNQRGQELFGYARDELIGRSVDQLVPARLRDRQATAFTAPTAPPTAEPDREPDALPARRELIGLRKSGVEIAIEVGVNPIETPEGTFSLASVIDITERVRYEDELRRSNAELEQFAYIASHDLQEPLRMVASYTELLAQRYQGQLDAKADKYIHYAVDGAKRMQRLVADLLAYSRVGSQGKSLVPVDARAIVHSVLHVLGQPLKAAGAQVTVGALPRVLADETQLRQLFQNLIGNALKFRGEAAPVIAIDAELVDDRWRFRVRDNGIGIDMQYAERIFEMFQRLHERGKYEGSGIGLAIAKRIVERHGGRIAVEPAPGGGAMFSFTLLPEPVS